MKWRGVEGGRQKENGKKKKSARGILLYKLRGGKKKERERDRRQNASFPVVRTRVMLC